MTAAAHGPRRHTHWWLDRCFLYVGRIAEDKGLLQILRAWLGLAGDVGARCPPLWLVGGSPAEVDAMREAAGIPELSGHEAEGRVRWWGYLDAAGISTLLLKAFVLVTHSRYEPGGRTVIEAMTQGIPVIATPHGFAAELVVDWHSGFLVPYGNVEMLTTRLAHFALQPLLRHVMGRTAQRRVSAALAEWRFVETHVAVYEAAMHGRPLPAPRAGPDWDTAPSAEPPPQGFDGVYPFEAHVSDTSDVTRFFAQQEGTIDDIHEGPPAARSRVWLITSGGRRWIVKHPFTTYARQAMWDRGYGGDLAVLQRHRLSGELLGSMCAGGAPVRAVDHERGLILREWLAPAPAGERTLATWVALLSSFHRSRVPSIDLADARRALDRDWRALSDYDVVATLEALHAAWRAAGRPWHPWQPLSLRLSWRWLELGLRRAWLRWPDTVATDVAACVGDELAAAASEDSGSSFDVGHGDCDMEHLRVDRDGQPVVVDCERTHPGYFGHDLATVIVVMMDLDADDQRAVRVVDEMLLRGEASGLIRRRLLLSWLRWTVATDLCRHHSLLGTAPLARAERQWRIVRRLSASPI